MNHPPVQVAFLQPFAPQITYAVLNITPYLKSAELNEYNMRHEGAVATMKRTATSNDPHSLTLEVESREWDETMDMLEAAQAVGYEVSLKHHPSRRRCGSPCSSLSPTRARSSCVTPARPTSFPCRNREAEKRQPGE